jgi:AraC-like DNA-binding protein
MKVSVATDSVAKNDQVAFWADLVCAHLVQVDCRQVVDQQAFNGAISKLSLPGCDIAQIHAGGQTVSRTPYQISRAAEEFFLVNIQRSGEGLVRQNGREVLLRPGDSALYSSVHPYELAFTGDFHQTVLIIPAAALRHVDRQIDRHCGVALPGDSGASRLLVKLVDALYESAEDVATESVASLVSAITQTLVGATPGLSTKSHGLTGYHLMHVKEFILRHLDDPELTAARIAEGTGISVSHLHRIFSVEVQTVMEWAWSRRLEACSRDLADLAKVHHTVADIAYHWGFNDCSHFSKAFRLRYDMTPTDWRREHVEQRRGSPPTK